MAYWLHCQFCGEWSKSLTPLSDDQSCSFCSRPFKAIKPYPKAPAKPLASEPQDVRENVQKYDIEVAETDGLQKAEVKEVPEPVQQTSLLSGENNETSNVMASEATHTVEIPVNTEEQVQEVEEIESSGERDSSEPLEPGDKPEVSEIPELPETLLIDEEPAVVDKDANDEPEVIPQAEEPIPATDANNAVEIAETNQIGETSQEEKELMGSEGTDEPKKSEMHINFIFETPQTTATPKQFEEITNQEDSGAAEVMETDQEDSGAAEVMETDQEDGGAAEAMETDQEDSGAAETMEIDKVRDYKENPKLPHSKKEPDLVTEAADENENKGDNLIRPEQNADKVPMWLDILDTPETGKIRITFTYGTPRAESKAKEPEVSETAESGAALETIEEKAAPEALATLPLESESGEEATGIKAGGEEASEAIDFSESAEKETISEKEEAEDKQEAPQAQEFSSIEIDDAEDKSALSELPDDAGDNPALPELPDDAEDKPSLPEPSDDTEDNPALPEPPDDAGDKPALSELSDDAEDNPALPESPDDAGDNSALPELPDDAEDKSALPELPDDAEDKSALPELPDDAGNKSAMCELSDDADSGGDTEASKRLDDTMEPGESTDEERSEPELNEPLSGLEEKHDAESETTETGQEEEMPINRNPRMTRTYEPYIEMRRRTRNSQP